MSRREEVPLQMKEEPIPSEWKKVEQAMATLKCGNVGYGKIHPKNMDEIFQIQENVDAPAVGGDATENIPYYRL